MVPLASPMSSSLSTGTVRPEVPGLAFCMGRTLLPLPLPVASLLELVVLLEEEELLEDDDLELELLLLELFEELEELFDVEEVVFKMENFLLL